MGLDPTRDHEGESSDTREGHLRIMRQEAKFRELGVDRSS